MTSDLIDFLDANADAVEKDNVGELVGQTQPVAAHRIIVEQHGQVLASQVDLEQASCLRPGNANRIGEDQAIGPGQVIEERRRLNDITRSIAEGQELDQTLDILESALTVVEDNP